MTDSDDDSDSDTCRTLYQYWTVLDWIVLYCTVLCVLYCTVLYCTVLYCVYCTVLYWSVLSVLCVLECTILYCTVLECTGVYWSVLCVLADIDECSINVQLCAHGQCVNYPGGYRCECDMGFTGADKERTCVGPYDQSVSAVRN